MSGILSFFWSHLDWHSSLQNLKDVVDNEEARKRGFPHGDSFKLLQFDIVLLTEDQSAAMRAGGEHYTMTETIKSPESWWTSYGIIIMYFGYSSFSGVW